MNLIVFLLVGLAAGWFASLIMRGRGLGLIGNLVVGVVGAFLGVFLFHFFGLHASGLIGTTVRATAGAVVLLALIKTLKKA